jgi:anti-sigma regulatory factor (Ser/Thr protein kinase)
MSSAVVVPCMSVELAAVPASVPAMRDALRGFLADHGAGRLVRARVTLATGEAVTNAVLHAYPDGQSGTVRIDADLEDDELEVVVSDHGRGFAADCEPSAGLGLGLALMRKESAEFEIHDRPLGGVEVWMRFPLRAEAA